MLALDARLALAKQEQAAHGGTTDGGQSASYYRQRETVSTLLRDWDLSGERPFVERPRGPLPIDKQNPGRYRAKGSNMQHLVREMGHKLNSELLLWLRERKYTKTRCVDDNSSHAYRRTCWRLRDRLSGHDILRLVMAYQTGITANELAAHYNIDVKSVRRVLRENGLRQRLGWGP